MYQSGSNHVSMKQNRYMNVIFYEKQMWNVFGKTSTGLEHLIEKIYVFEVSRVSTMTQYQTSDQALFEPLFLYSYSPLKL